MATEDEIDRAARAVWEGTFPSAVVDQITGIVAGGESASLLSAILRLARATSATDADAAEETMERLEPLGEKVGPAACLLMAQLWGIAAGLFLHDICDAIDLWMGACNSPLLAAGLSSMARSEADPALRRHYEAWVRGLNGRH
jgi:hypothetical protein